MVITTFPLFRASYVMLCTIQPVENSDGHCTLFFSFFPCPPGWWPGEKMVVILTKLGNINHKKLKKGNMRVEDRGL